MSKLTRARFLGAFVFLISSANATHATTLVFSFSGTEFGGGRGTSTGMGRFTFTGSPPAISLEDLTSFSFMQTHGFGFPPGPCTFSYGLTDLTSFSFGLANGLPTAFLLTTNFTPGTNPATGYVCLSESFTITGLGTTGAFTRDPNGIATIGKVSFGPTPAGLIGLDRNRPLRYRIGDAYSAEKVPQPCAPCNPPVDGPSKPASTGPPASTSLPLRR